MFVRSSALAIFLYLADNASGALDYSYNPMASNGPPKWGTVNTGDSPNDCDGKSNSPVALESSGCDVYADYSFTPGTCTTSDMKFTINNHGVKADFGGDCVTPKVEIPGQDEPFYAAQFHIHTGSEHTIDGVTFGGEMHIVHLNEAGTKAAVVGKKINPSSPENNVAFQFLLDGWYEVHNAQQEACGTTCGLKERVLPANDGILIEPYYLVGDDNDYYTYPGGLTTPPCTEFVAWNVAEEPLSIAVDQYADLVDLILGYKENCADSTLAYHGSTSRPTQPLWGREVKKICPSSKKSSASNEKSPTGTSPTGTPPTVTEEAGDAVDTASDVATESVDAGLEAQSSAAKVAMTGIAFIASLVAMGQLL